MCYFMFENCCPQPSSMLSTQGGSPWMPLRACCIIQDNAILLQSTIYIQINQIRNVFIHTTFSHKLCNQFLTCLRFEGNKWGNLVCRGLLLRTTYWANFSRGLDLLKPDFFHLSRPLQVSLDAIWMVEMKHSHPSGGDFLTVLPKHQVIKYPDSTAFATGCSSQAFSGFSAKAENREMSLDLHCAVC